MRLPELVIKNKQFIYVVIGIVILVGIRSFTTMPKAEDPLMDLPLYTIVVVYPGTSPEDMEEFVVDPLEEALSDLDDINEIRTEITNGLAVLKIETEFNINYDDKYGEITSKVDNIRNSLPSGIYDLQISQYKPEDQTIIQQYALVSQERTYGELYDIADELRLEIEQLSDVKKSQILAFPREEIKINLDFQKIAQLGIPLNQIINKLKANNTLQPGGTIESGNLSFNIQTSGNYRSIEDIKRTTLTSEDNEILYLEDVASITHGYEEDKWLARFNGKRAIFLTVNQKRQANILDLSEHLEQVATNYSKTLPKNISLEKAFEQAPAVKNRLSNFISNLLQGIFLVGMIIWIFLGWRSGLVVIIAIPLSIITGIILLDYFGFALQQISIAALMIALGLLVDNAIVVVENIKNHYQDGASVVRAAIDGTKEVGYAILSSTLTTILAFAPLALLESGPGEYLRSLPLTVIFVLTASLLIALTITPLISSKLLKKESDNKPKTRAIEKLDDLVLRYYRPSLKFALKKGWFIIVLGVSLFVFSIILFPKIGISFFPTADKNLLLINIETPSSSSIHRTDQAVQYVEKVLDTTAYARSYVSNIGHGNPQVYYNRVPKEYNKNHGEVLVNFKEWNRNKFDKTIRQLQNAFLQYPDAKINFSELKNGSPFEAPIEIQILGNRLEVIKDIAAEIEIMLLNTPGTKNVKNPLAISKTDMQVTLNKEKAALYDLSLMEIDRTIRVAQDGIQIGELSLERKDKKYPLVVSFLNADKDFGNFNIMSVANQKGFFVPIKQIAHLEFTPEYSKISHYNKTRSTAITADVENPDNTKELTEQIISKLNTYSLPEGYNFHVGGEYETQQDSFGNLAFLLALALLGIFAVLVLQFRSLIQPLIIFSAIPLAVTGSFFALYLSGWSFSFFEFVGFISLIGIVVNNSIILVDFSNQLRKKGLKTSEAIQLAAETRFTPILLTTLTTILGLIPLTFSGTTLWSPLGWTLIGGLISSMLLTILVVPILYNWFTKHQ